LIVVANTVIELELLMGERLKAIRLGQNLDQKTVASRAGISVGALKNLEHGSGSTTKSLIAVVRTLGREAWLATIAPIATIDPLNLPKAASQRQRARRKVLKGDKDGIHGS
jgi:transcriptional regulator with XRE-family HTH domain